MSHESSDIPIDDESQPINPYASPQTVAPHLVDQDQFAPVGIWRQGASLLMHRDAVLPARCIMTNAKCDETERRVYTVHSRINYYLICAFCLFIAICTLKIREDGRAFMKSLVGASIPLLIAVFAILRRPAELPVAYSYSHGMRWRRRKRRYCGAGLFCLGFLCVLVAVPLQISLAWPEAAFGIIVGTGVLLILAGGILFAFYGLPLRFWHRSGPYVVIEGCGREFLQNFPESS